MNRIYRIFFGCLIFFALNHLLDCGPFNMLVVFAQSTTVTGQVKDANGIPYAGAQIKAQLVLAGAGVTGQATVTVNNTQQCRSAGQGSAPCQVPFQGTSGPITLDSGGNIPAGGWTLQDNSQVTPAGTQWLITVSQTPGVPPPLGTGPQTCSATLTITGASQSIGASFAACPALSNTGASGSGVVTGFTTQGTGTDSGVANAYVATVTFPAGQSATVSGSQFRMTVNNSNTAASTINVNGSGAVAVKTTTNAALTGGEMTAGSTYTYLNIGGGFWILAGSLAGTPALTSDRVNVQMIGPLGINGTTSINTPTTELFTPFLTSNAPLQRPAFVIQCNGNASSGCSLGQNLQFGFDADGVGIFTSGGGSQIAFVNNVESFSTWNFFGSGTASADIISVNDASHPLHTSGRLFGVTDTNGRINFQILATAGPGSRMTMDDTIAIGTQSVSGCALTAAVGGSWAGKFNSGTTGACTVTITFPDTANTGWTCDAHDTTTVADVINQTAFTTTTATISGTTASGDVITWKCVGF